MKNSFDVLIDRRGTSCLKYDFGMERKGRDDLLPLWVADMDFRLPDEVIEDLQKRVSHGIFGYTDPKDDYYDALNRWFSKRHGYTVDRQWNIITPGVVYAISMAIRALTKEGDSILIQQPVYYPFASMVKLNNRNVVNNQLVFNKEAGRYEIDFDDLEKKIKEEKVKMVLFCSPHNPVGRVWTREEILRFADICKENDVYIFADEIHADFVYEGHKHISFMTLDDEYREKLIVGTSPSKTFNIAGLQIANIFVPNESVRDALKKENDAAGYSQCNAIGLTATTSVYTKGEEWLDDLLRYLKDNVDFVRSFLQEKLPQIKLIEPEGTYLIWLDFSGVSSDHKELEKIVVDEAHLWLDPGIIFGRETALFERINIAAPRATIEKALEQLCAAVIGHK